MVKSYFPCPILEVPERIQNQMLRYDVCSQKGEVSAHFGRCLSIKWLLSSLERRLSSDASLASVCVFLPSGRLLCHYWRFA